MKKLLAIVLATTLLACNSGPASSQGDSAAPASAKPFKTMVVADFTSPWAMAFLPDGQLLITEKAGQLVLFDPARRQATIVAWTPKADNAGQGGLMDIVPAPDFLQSRYVYFSYSEADASGKKGVVLARAKLDGQNLTDCMKTDGSDCSQRVIALFDEQILFRATPYVEGDGHYSGRIAFSPDGKYLFFTNGERQKFDPAQDPKSTLGKVLRLNLDGTPAAGNPLAAKGFHPAVWSYGHRNLLGLAFDGEGRLWEQEMGPMGGDELNLIQPGRNYGYPHVSNGDHYDGRPIPDHAPGDGYEPPKLWWNPVISPGGLLYYSGALFPAWKGSLFIGGLSSKALIRVKLDGENAANADQWDMGERIRDVEQGPDGAIWVIEDGQRGGQGRLLKLTAG